MFLLFLAFLVSDPSVTAVGCNYQIYKNEVILVDAPNEPDGSINWEITGLEDGYHKIKVRYKCPTAESAFVNFTLKRFTPLGKETPDYTGYEKGSIRLKTINYH